LRTIGSRFSPRTSTLSRPRAPFMHSLAPAHVAVLIEMSSAYGRGLIRGIAEYVHSRTEWSLHLEEIGPITSIPTWMRSWRGDGIVARIETPGIARLLVAKGVPVVNVSGRTSPPGVPHVDLDNGGVCKLAADYFAERGFRNFAYSGNTQFQWSAWRREHFAREVAAVGATCEVLECDDSPADRQRMQSWLKALPKPVAVLACNDRRGCAVLEICRQIGLAVPQEVAVLGVDNDEILCTLSRPQLSSVVPDPDGIGYVAAQTLDELLHGRQPGAMEHWVQPLTICSRQSTDAVAVSDWHVSQALRIIEGQALYDLHVDAVASQVRTSRRYLEERFRAVLGCSIHDEIFRVRLTTAQRLLSTTALALKDVAARSGFRRADYLSVVFREKLGVSPSAYRARYR
jgi:LacI family transcriptional regulator